jgi:hypothetical protein
MVLLQLTIELVKGKMTVGVNQFDRKDATDEERLIINNIADYNVRALKLILESDEVSVKVTSSDDEKEAL